MSWVWDARPVEGVVVVPLDRTTRGHMTNKPPFIKVTLAPVGLVITASRYCYACGAWVNLDVFEMHATHSLEAFVRNAPAPSMGSR